MASFIISPAANVGDRVRLRLQDRKGTVKAVAVNKEARPDLAEVYSFVGRGLLV